MHTMGVIDILSLLFTVTLLISTCEGESCHSAENDSMVALQTAKPLDQVSGCRCGYVCEGYNIQSDFCDSDVARAFIAARFPNGDAPSAFVEAVTSNAPIYYQEVDGVIQVVSNGCWTRHGIDLWVGYQIMTNDTGECPPGFDQWCSETIYACWTHIYNLGLETACKHGWCTCNWIGCGCSAGSDLCSHASGVPGKCWEDPPPPLPKDPQCLRNPHCYGFGGRQRGECKLAKWRNRMPEAKQSAQST
eukprot:TRINITY_DN18667_c0_g1_i1.p1 TRINITY_DN18667_c0_g1~~TRINITY_DN18667_c0_g1_i1.p1  ORF type:complete len:247 (-),score=24.72 TRINITY_DN18667_c0_g1_i1:162-902(-)